LTGLWGVIALLGLTPLEGAPLDAKGQATGRPKTGQGNLPQIGVSGWSDANEDSGQAITFMFSRTGSTSGPLEVGYTVGGTATPGATTQVWQARRRSA